MDYRLHHSLYNEIVNRYDSMFISVIRSHFLNKEDQKDIYQEFCIHLFLLIETHYSKKVDLLHTATWLKAVVSNFCKSQLRKKNEKKQVKFSPDSYMSSHLEQFTEDTLFNSPIFEFGKYDKMYGAFWYAKNPKADKKLSADIVKAFEGFFNYWKKPA